MRQPCFRRPAARLRSRLRGPDRPRLRRAARAGAPPGRGSCSSRAAAPRSRRLGPAGPARPRSCASVDGGRRARSAASRSPAVGRFGPARFREAGSGIGPPRRRAGAVAPGRRGASPSSSRPEAGSRGPRSGASCWLSISSSTGRPRCLALEPAVAIVRARVGAVVGLAGDVEPVLFEHRPVVGGLGPERGQEVAHHHAVETGPDGERLQLLRGSRPGRRRAGTGRPGMISRKIATHLTTSHGSISSRSPNLVPLRGLSRLIGIEVGFDLGQLEGHLDPLARRLPEVEDAADAGLETGLADRVDRPDPALVADRRRHLVVVGARGLDVVVDPLHAGVGEPLGARRARCGRPRRSASGSCSRRPAWRPRRSSRSPASTGPGPG